MILLLAVQDSSIGDLVTRSLTHLLILSSPEQCRAVVDLSDKVNRCLARYSPRATTTNRPANRAPKKPAWPGPN